MRPRVFYLFHRFIKEDRNEISTDVAVSLLENIQDLLPILAEIPELDDNEHDPLTEAVNSARLVDTQLYLFEAAGTLVSLFYKTPDRAGTLLLSVVKPLMDQLSLNLQSVKGPDDILPILTIHHDIMALGSVAKGYPDYPSVVSPTYIPPPLDVFSQVAQAILVSLEAMNIFRVVRDAVSFMMICESLMSLNILPRLVLPSLEFWRLLVQTSLTSFRLSWPIYWPILSQPSLSIS